MIPLADALLGLARAASPSSPGRPARSRPAATRDRDPLRSSRGISPIPSGPCHEFLQDSRHRAETLGIRSRIGQSQFRPIGAVEAVGSSSRGRPAMRARLTCGMRRPVRWWSIRRTDAAAPHADPPPEPSVSLMKTATRIGWTVLIVAVVAIGPVGDGPGGCRDVREARRGGPGGPRGGGRPRRAPRRRQRGGRGGRDGLRPGRDAARGRQPGRRRLHRRLPGRSHARSSRSTSARSHRRRRRRRCTSAPTASPGPDTATGAWAAGVPGTVRGLALAHARWGKRPWAELVRPAVRLAREGFPISDDLAGRSTASLAASRSRRRRTTTARPRTTSAGWATIPSRSPRSASPTARPGAPATGSSSPTWPPPSTGSPRAAPDEFYTGRTAELIAGYMERARRLHHARRPEVLPGQGPAARPHHVPRLRRLRHRARRRPAASSSARCSTSSSGSTSRPTAATRPRTLHRVTEAMRRAFFTRATRLADPDFVDRPGRRADLEGLRRRAGPIDRRPGHPQRRAGPVPDPGRRRRPHDPPLDPRRRRQRRGADLHPGGLATAPSAWSPGRGSCSTTRWATST